MTGARLHVLGDLLNSIGVIIAAVIIWFEPSAKIADPIVTFVFTLIIIGTSYPTVKSCILTLMEATPANVDYDKVEAAIKNVEGVAGVHDLHIWSLTNGKNALSAHITSEDPFKTLKRVEHELKDHHNMVHVTIQIEHPHHGHEDKFSCESTLHKPLDHHIAHHH
jgi:cobalt-zinc-cadmium efflux system protein